mmetsp:Transcript_41641/g.54845  ORF Transcript_41641/g.54845 Transcript_41641/m.54845 type:complete len:91 (-) Transcript_41641:36-308(-)
MKSLALSIIWLILASRAFRAFCDFLLEVAAGELSLVVAALLAKLVDASASLKSSNVSSTNLFSPAADGCVELVDPAGLLSIRSRCLIDSA